MTAQQMWEARTSGPKRAEAPASGQAVGASENAQSETVHIPKNTLVEHSKDSTGARPTGSGIRALPRRVNPNDGRFIRAVVAGTAVAGLVAFSISFAALYEVAAWLGLPPFMHWAVPVFIDLAILVYAGSVLVHESRGESARASWWALGAFTGLSMIANGAHAWSAENASVWQSVVGALIAVMVPVAVFVATDQLARVAVENPDSRRAERASQVSEEAEQLKAQAELDRQRAVLEAELAASRRQIETEREDREVQQAVVEESQVAQGVEVVEAVASSEPVVAETKTVEKASGADITAWIVARAQERQVPSAAEVAEKFGCSERTGRRRLADARETHAEAFGTGEEQA